jgi:plasmid stabilization system protein ParE
MTWRVVLRPVAEDEVRDAYDWYEARREGLGGEFLACVDEALERIARMPQAPSPVHRDVRRVLLRRFPHGVFYVVEADVVVVLAVFHQRRDAAQWRGRR